MPQPHQPAATEAQEGSRDLVYDLLKERVATQLSQSDGLDSKANNILVAASALLAAGLVLQGALLTVQTATFAQAFSITRIDLVVVLVCYLVTMAAALIGGFWVRAFQQIPEPEPFVRQYLARPVDETKAVIIETQLEVYQRNQRVLDVKVLALRIASFGLGAEVLALLVLLMLQLF